MRFSTINENSSKSLGERGATIYCDKVAADAISEANLLGKKNKRLKAIKKEISGLEVVFPNGTRVCCDVPKRFLSDNYEMPSGIPTFPFNLSLTFGVKCLGFWTFLKPSDIFCFTGGGPAFIIIYLRAASEVIKFAGTLEGDVEAMLPHLPHLPFLPRDGEELLQHPDFHAADVRLYDINVANDPADRIMNLEQISNEDDVGEYATGTEVKKLTLAFPDNRVLKQAWQKYKKQKSRNDLLIPYDNQCSTLVAKCDDGFQAAPLFQVEIKNGKRVRGSLYGPNDTTTSFEYWEMKPKPCEEEVWVPFSYFNDISFWFGSIPIVGRFMVVPCDDGILVLRINGDFHLQLWFSYESTIFDYGPFEDDPSRVLYARILNSISEKPFRTFGYIDRQQRAEPLPARVRARLEWVRVRMFPILPRLECLGIDIHSVHDMPESLHT